MILFRNFFYFILHSFWRYATFTNKSVLNYNNGNVIVSVIRNLNHHKKVYKD
jgi:hypothetical protein